jgi:peptide/nickel transport system substrate-binding protein
LKAGQVEMIVEPPVTVWESVKDDPAFTILSTPTAATRTLRVRVDQDPWKDNRVRQALKHCHNREKILALALRNQGVIGNDSHVAPAQSEYTPLEPYPFDTEKSMALLKEAGVTTPVKVEINVASDWPESMAYAQALKEDAAAGGFDITLKPMPASQYWDGWTEFNTGITWWAHRPLATMLLPQAYVADADGKPVPWNETRWVDEEFSTLLTEASATLDLDKRKGIVAKLAQIQKERGSICTPLFMNVWQIYQKNIKGVEPSPEEYCILHAAWKEQA